MRNWSVGRNKDTTGHTVIHSFHGEQLTYRYAGRDFRLTDVAGEPVREIFA